VPGATQGTSWLPANTPPNDLVLVNVSNDLIALRNSTSFDVYMGGLPFFSCVAKAWPCCDTTLRRCASPWVVCPPLHAWSGPAVTPPCGGALQCDVATF
jgi:hypothetical protein